jgi:hypothetical protein
MKICVDNPDLVKIEQKYWALYVKTQLWFMLLAVTCSATISTMYYCVSMTILEIFIMFFMQHVYVNNTKEMHCIVSIVTMVI